MSHFLLFFYVALFIYAIKSENDLYFAGVILLGVLSIFIFKQLRKISINKTRKLADKINNCSGDADTKPFVNVNKSHWSIFEQLPGFSRVQAKKVLWIKRHNGPYKSVDDFLDKNSITDEGRRELLRKMVFVK